MKDEPLALGYTTGRRAPKVRKGWSGTVASACAGAVVVGCLAILVGLSAEIAFDRMSWARERTLRPLCEAALLPWTSLARRVVRDRDFTPLVVTIVHTLAYGAVIGAGVDRFIGFRVFARLAVFHAFGAAAALTIWYVQQR